MQLDCIELSTILLPFHSIPLLVSVAKRRKEGKSLKSQSLPLSLYDVTSLMYLLRSARTFRSLNNCHIVFIVKKIDKWTAEERKRFFGGDDDEDEDDDGHVTGKQRQQQQQPRTASQITLEATHNIPSAPTLRRSRPSSCSSFSLKVEGRSNICERENCYLIPLSALNGSSKQSRAPQMVARVLASGIRWKRTEGKQERKIVERFCCSLLPFSFSTSALFPRGNNSPKQKRERKKFSISRPLF